MAHHARDRRLLRGAVSKGDSPRPHDPARYRSEWERIFTKPKDALRELTRLWEDEHHRNDPARGETGEET